ncbi:DNA polymerase alpha catalytic subunit [Nilaparvata lugens]|uniref:DNA polymerase alpha catalytic subunit n=1 Tax=Nilaparvata lugens TaxID=108931 RepID=UPI00193EA460|nr:DNA polymerase alpha catalytic subunit [Nilaparvata lugens]
MEDSDIGVQPLSTGRSRREKKDKHGRLAALDRLRKLKGAKNKYEVSDIDNVYEEVDEREYSERVLQRQEDEFIVDDDGAGYAEDGREIFDEDIYMEESEASRQKGGSKASGRGRKREPSDVDGEASKRAKSGDIRKLIGNIAHIPSKKKTEAKKLDEDSHLQEILKDFNPLDNEQNRRAEKQFSNISTKDYLKSFAPVQSRKMETFSPARQITINRNKNISPAVANGVSNKLPEIRPMPVRIKREVVDHNLEQYDDHGDDFGLALDDFNEDDIKDLPPHIPDKKEDDTTDRKQKENELSANIKLEEVKKEQNTDVAKTELELEMDFGMDEFAGEADAWMTEEHARLEKQPQKTESVESKNFDDDWEKIINNTESKEEIGDRNCKPVDNSKLPLIETEKKEKVIYFYYLDAHDEYFLQPGTVFLFGKLWDEKEKSCQSCCVTVKNIYRKILLLPREKKINIHSGKISDDPVSMKDVYEEFAKSVSAKYKILDFKCRTVTKSYAFDMNEIPLVSEYLEVRYPAKYQKLPNDLHGETFSHAFGMNRSFVEHLLVEKKIKGPRWMAIKNPAPVSNQMTWCRYEVTCSDSDLITVFDDDAVLKQLGERSAPPITVLTLSARVACSPNKRSGEFVSIACLVSKNFPLEGAAPKQQFQQHFSAVTKLSDKPWPLNMGKLEQYTQSLKLDKCESERTLLNYFMARFYRIDPDLIVCHDFADADLNLLIKKLLDHRIAHWSRIGRLRRTKRPQLTNVVRTVMCGRLVCDLKATARELIKARSYDLDTLCCDVLHLKEGQKDCYTPDEVYNAFNDIDSLIKLLRATLLDASYILKLMCELNALPLALQITNIAGNVLSRTLTGGRSERNEFLLLHAFEDKGYIVPEKIYKSKENAVKEEEDCLEGPSSGGAGGPGGRQNATSARRKPAYAGGLVLEPKRGLYDRLVLLMDFNSLYPSIIQEYNICYTTIDRQQLQEDDDILTLPLPGPDVKAGVLPSQIRQLVESRRVVKNLMKQTNISQDQRMQYEIRQLALKLMANSMYGCLGFAQSRFCCKPLAALVTAKGREILMRTKELVENLGFEVVYGDTDSLMINTNTLDYANVKKIGLKIKAEVNRHYKQLELDIDGIFRCLLLCKKKKYAASVIVGQAPDGSLQTKQEIKGLDVVRRDWCRMSSEAGKFILAQILSDQDSDERVANIHQHLTQLRADLEAGGRVPLQLLTIGKQLAKEVAAYQGGGRGGGTNLPHVLVAARANQRKPSRFKAGDVVHYLICQDGTTNAATQRAYLIEELKNNPELKIDVNYYLEQQILPVISRICEPIPGCEPARIAQSLGLDYAKLEKMEAVKYDDDTTGYNKQLKQQHSFEHCEKFSFNCVKCGTANVMEGPTKTLENGVEILCLNRCSNSECAIQPKQYLPRIRNSLTLFMRGFVKKYYTSWLVCEDRYCLNRSRSIWMKRINGQPVCENCTKHDPPNVMKLEYTEYEIYTQLIYLQKIFDLSKVPSSIRIEPEVQKAYNLLEEDVKKILKLNGYAFVNLSNLFLPLSMLKIEK